jgi:signal transduction histidine kinase
MIDRHGTRIAEIIRGLLAFARKTPFQLVETDLNRIIREVVALVEKPYVKQGIRIQSVLEPTLPSFRASPLHIQQVFMNLLKNARDAMPEGGPVTLRTSKNGRYLVAEVEDAGPGIAPEVEARLFEPFFTTKGVGEGTGLGLSVSYGIVSAHGGKILIESKPGHGALFRVMLPIEGTPS